MTPLSAPSTQSTPPGAIQFTFLWHHPAHFIGLGLGSGLAPKAPGTFGTLCGWLLFLPIQIMLPVWAQGVVILVSIAVGWWACTVTSQHLTSPDPGCIVWDEIAAFWLVLWLLSPQESERFQWPHWGWQIVAFALFRFFDAVKPGPVAWADQVFKGTGWRGGWGIMFDDLVAAACTLLVLALVRFFIGQ